MAHTRKRKNSHGGDEHREDSPRMGRMVVAVRVRPLSEKEESEGKRSCVKVFQDKCVVIEKAAKHGGYLSSQKKSSSEFQFDAAFGPSSDQTIVYETAAASHVAAVLEGYNVTVFAYGATGAGKTHTMMGTLRVDATTANSTESPAEESGVIPLALRDLFAGVAARRAARARDGEGGEEEWAVEVSYLEVYNEAVYDLLSDDSSPCRARRLEVREDPKRGAVEVAGLRAVGAATAAEVLALLREGNARRKTESTAVNSVSSRSHAVLRVTVLRERACPATGARAVGRAALSLIDLAGSERAQQNTGQRLQEGAKINTSLLSLANCINALAKKGGGGGGGKRPKPNFRDSKLTHLLKPSLTGNCRIVMIANINPSSHCYEDTLQTLKYADRAKNIKVDASIMKTEMLETNSAEREIALIKENKRLATENKKLKKRIQELEALLDGRSGGGGGAGTPLDAAENSFQNFRGDEEAAGDSLFLPLDDDDGGGGGGGGAVCEEDSALLDRSAWGLLAAAPAPAPPFGGPPAAAGGEGGEEGDDGEDDLTQELLGSLDDLIEEENDKCKVMPPPEPNLQGSISGGASNRKRKSLIPRPQMQKRKTLAPSVLSETVLQKRAVLGIVSDNRNQDNNITQQLGDKLSSLIKKAPPGPKQSALEAAGNPLSEKTTVGHRSRSAARTRPAPCQGVAAAAATADGSRGRSVSAGRARPVAGAAAAARKSMLVRPTNYNTRRSTRMSQISSGINLN